MMAMLIPFSTASRKSRKQTRKTGEEGTSCEERSAQGGT